MANSDFRIPTSEFSCYLCNYSPAPHKLSLKDSFTAHSLCKNPASEWMCDRCYQLINGNLQQVAYFKDNEYKALWSRNTSWLLKDPRNLDNPINQPCFKKTVTVKGKSLKVLENSPSRSNIREFLLNPPDEPFEVAIAESGKKHILFLAQTAYNKLNFPIVFELDTVWINASTFSQILNAYEQLMALGFSKTEINTGEFRSDRLQKALGKYEESEDFLKWYRTTRLFQLVAFVGGRRQEAEGRRN